MDEIPDAPHEGPSARIPMLAVVLVVVMAVAAAVMVKPAISELADQRPAAKAGARAPVQPPGIGAPQVRGSVRSVDGRAGPG